MSDTSLYLDLRKQAETLFPKDEKAQNDFIEGFVEKTANILAKALDNPLMNVTPKQHSVGDAIAHGAAGAIGKALVGGTVAAGFAGLMSLGKIVSDHALHNEYMKALNEAIRTNRILKAADPHKVLIFGNTIFKFAPHVATDSNMLSSILANAIHGDGIDPMTIRTLTELEGRYQQIGKKEWFNPKQWS